MSEQKIEEQSTVYVWEELAEEYAAIDTPKTEEVIVLKRLWYVLTSNTSWCNVDEAIYSGPHTTKEEALEHTKFNGFVQSDRWVELLTEEEAQALTY